LLAGEADPAAIENRIVVLGATVTGGGDVFSTPFEPVMPGVEVVSTAIAQLVSGDVVRRDRSVQIADGLTTVLLPMLLVGMLAWRRSTAGILAVAAVGLGWMSAIWLAFSSGVWLNTALPIAGMAPPVVLFGAIQLWSGRRQAHYFAMKSRLLGQFQAPDIQEWLTRDPRFLAEPVSQNAAIIFIDLSGFTSLSEAAGPHDMQELLKHFHALVDHEAISSRGTVTGFQGDGAMILFGLPEAAPDDALRAAHCAVRLCVATQQWLASLPVSIASQLGFKVGAHFGIIVASRLGGESHHHITATGDTVNVASRLMGIAAHHDVQLAVGDELLRAAGPDCALLKTGRLYGPHEAPVRGRSATVTTWLWKGP
jgi:adenylate cyclase